MWKTKYNNYQIYKQVSSEFLSATNNRAVQKAINNVTILLCKPKYFTMWLWVQKWIP